MQGARVGFPVQVHDGLHGFGGGVVWLDSQSAIQHRFFFSIASEITVTQRKLLKRVQVARVELKRTLQVLYGFFPPSLPPLDVTGQLEYLWIVRQALTGNAQFSQSTIVIEVSPIKIPRTPQVRFTCVRTKARGRCEGCFSQRQACRGVVKAIKIKQHMS